MAETSVEPASHKQLGEDIDVLNVDSRLSGAFWSFYKMRFYTSPLKVGQPHPNHLQHSSNREWNLVDVFIGGQLLYDALNNDQHIVGNVPLG